MDIKTNIKAARKKARISQRKLSEITGLSFSMVSKLETGEAANPSLETLEKIATALNVTVPVLIGGDIFDLWNANLPDQDPDQVGILIQYLSSIGYEAKTFTSSSGEKSIIQIKRGDEKIELNFEKWNDLQNELQKTADFYFWKQCQRKEQ